MFKRLFFAVCLVSLLAVGSMAQARRTVTNADLERYRQSRLVAERELREDFVRLGFPSPEERERREFDSRQQAIELAERLRQERLEDERLEFERARLMQPIVPFPPRFTPTLQPGELFWPDFYYQNYGDGRGRHRAFRNGPVQQGYFAGGQFWPTGPRTPLQPQWKTAPKPRPRH